MREIASFFTPRMKEEINRHLGIALSDEYDYSDEELEEIFFKITEDFPYAFDADGNPLEMGSIFEDILDVFFINNLPH